jgi:hypothetical protein
VIADQPAQACDVVLEGRFRRRRYEWMPELLDQVVGRDDGVRLKQQQRQELSLAARSDRHHRAVTSHLERAEDPEFELSHLFRRR